MMRWEVFKQLSKADKEEFNFRFGHDEVPRMSIVYLIVLYPLVSMWLMAAYLSYTQILPLMVELRVHIHLIMSITVVMVFVWLADYVMSWVMYSLRGYQKYKWVKARIPKARWREVC